MKAISAANLDKDAKASPLISVGYSKLNLFGEDMVTSCGVAARALNALAMAGIEVLLITTSDLDISLLVHCLCKDIQIAGQTVAPERHVLHADHHQVSLDIDLRYSVHKKSSVLPRLPGNAQSFHIFM